MTENARTVLREALALSPDKRAPVAADLIASLDQSQDDPEAVARAWADELERRADAMVQDPSMGENWDDVRNRIAEGLGGE